MNEYQDQESEPVPQPGLVDGERVRQRVLGQVAGRRRRKLRRAVIAAVAAAACLGLVAWTWGERIYQMASGGQVTIGEGYGSVTMSDGKGEEGEPLVVSLEAGRLWFVAGGERTDITDLVDEDTPYVHTYTDGEGVLHYFLVGGTPEDYGWFEGLKAPDGSGGGAGVLSSVVPEPGTVETAEEPGWYTAGTAQVSRENKMGEAGGCQAARGLCLGRNAGPRAVCRGFGPCMVRTPPGPCAGARPRPARPSGAIAPLIRHGICRPAQGLRRGAPLYDPNRPPGERYGGSTPGGAEALTALAFSPKFCYPPWKDRVQRGGGTGWSSCGSRTLRRGPSPICSPESG